MLEFFSPLCRTQSLQWLTKDTSYREGPGSFASAVFTDQPFPNTPQLPLFIIGVERNLKDNLIHREAFRAFCSKPPRQMGIDTVSKGL